MNSTNDAGDQPGSARWLIPVALHAAVLIAYLGRLNVSVALPMMADEYGWTTEQVGLYGGRMMAAFYVGYALSNIFVSAPAARLGARRGMFAIFVLFPLCTMAGLPLSGIIGFFAFSRFATGVAQGPLFPLLTAATKRWFPVRERSRANGIYISGLLLAPLLSPLLLVPAASWLGWRGMFVLLSAISMAVALPVLWRYFYDTPEQSPHIGRAEAAYIAAGLEQEEFGQGNWLFLRDRRFWWALIIGILNNFTVFGVMYWLPTYFVRGRGLPFDNLAYAASLPFAAGLLGVGFMAWLGDRSNRRVLTGGIGYLMTAGCVCIAATRSGLTPTIAWFAAAVFLQFAYGAQEFAILQRILPASAISTGAGLYNGVAVLVGGLLSSEGIGRLVAATGSYTAGMWSVVVGAVITGGALLRLARTLHY